MNLLRPFLSGIRKWFTAPPLRQQFKEILEVEFRKEPEKPVGIKLFSKFNSLNGDSK